MKAALLLFVIAQAHPSTPHTARDGSACLHPRVIDSTPRDRPLNYGVVTNKGWHRGEYYSGETAEARRFVSGAKAEAERDRPHLTVIGSAAERKAVLDDLAHHPALVGVRDLVQVQDYDPGHWAVQGIYPPGSPTIIFQSPAGADGKGRVLWRADNYSVGPEGLAEAIRRANPEYRPEMDPGPAASGASCPLGFRSNHWPHIIASALAILYALRNPRKVDPR